MTIGTTTPGGTALDAALASAFDALAHGVADHRSPFRTPVLATTGTDEAPQLRTVVLRAFDLAARRLHIHTDRRSAKVAQIVADPRAALHGYDPATRMQLRLACHATLHLDDAAADSAWAASRETSRMTYATAHPPGMILPAPSAAPDDALAGRANFALMVLAFGSLDWLLLESAGHARARFDWAADGTMTAHWIAP